MLEEMVDYLVALWIAYTEDSYVEILYIASLEGISLS